MTINKHAVSWALRFTAAILLKADLAPNVCLAQKIVHSCFCQYDQDDYMETRTHKDRPDRPDCLDRFNSFPTLAKDGNDHMETRLKRNYTTCGC